MSLLAADITLVGFNVVNSYIDAYKIRRLNKVIRHGINLGSYLILFSVLAYKFIFLQVWDPQASLLPNLIHLLAHTVPFLISALANRQITFDIPLNLRRGLKWDYVSLDRPPKAWWDSLEVRVFGYNGRLSTAIYAVLWIICTLIHYSINS